MREEAKRRLQFSQLPLDLIAFLGVRGDWRSGSKKLKYSQFGQRPGHASLGVRPSKVS